MRTIPYEANRLSCRQYSRHLTVCYLRTRLTKLHLQTSYSTKIAGMGLHRFPSDVIAAVTLLNSFSWAGRSFPPVLQELMYLVEELDTGRVVPVVVVQCCALVYVRMNRKTIDVSLQFSRKRHLLKRPCTTVQDVNY